MGKSKPKVNPDQLSLFSTDLYGQPITEASIDTAGYDPSWKMAYRIGDTFIYNPTSRLDILTTRLWIGKEATITDLNPPSFPGRIQITFSDGTWLYLKSVEMEAYGYGAGRKQKSSPVARDSVQRENFQWVESYLVKQRFLYWRYCHLRSIDGIRQVVKIHIPGTSRSVREGRMQRVKEAIASGNISPDQIEQLIRQWQVE